MKTLRSALVSVLLLSGLVSVSLASVAGADTSNNVTATIGVVGGPYGVAVNPTTGTVYVANFLSNSVSVIDGSSNTVTATIGAGTNLFGVAVNPTTGTVYVVNPNSDSVSVIDGSSNTVTATIGVGTNPCGVAVNPTTGKVYVTNAGSNSVSVIDGSSNTVTATIAVGGFPYGVAVNSTTGTVYVANVGSNSVQVINGSSNTVTINPPSSQAAQNLTWTWSDPDPSVTSYSWTGACSGSGFVTSVTCKGLTGGQSYSLSVTATNPNGTSDPATSTGVAEDVPGTVTFSSPSVVGRGQGSFSWSDSVTNGAPITSYSWTGACSGSGFVTSVTCSGLRGGTSQTLSVSATNAMGTGPSAASTLKMPITSPDSVAPSITVAGTSFTASWAAPHNGGAALTGYTVTVLGANNKLISSTTLKSTVLTFTQSKLTTGATYTLSIAAANTSLLTSSPFVSSVTPKNPETLTVPAKLSYSYGASSTKVSVSLSIKATGTVSFTTGSTTLCVAKVSSTAVNCSVNSTLLNAGSYPLSVSYSGDSLTSIAIRAGTLTVTPASSTLKVSTNVNAVTSARLGALLVSTSLGSTIGSIPPGIVSLSLDGAQITTNAATFAFATWKPSKPLTKGVHTLTANYGGSTNYSAVSGFCKFVVQ